MRVPLVHGDLVGRSGLMCDGKRTFTITMTNAQYDVMKAAVDQIFIEWKEQGRIRLSDRQTLMRAFKHLSDQFEQGSRG